MIKLRAKGKPNGIENDIIGKIKSSNLYKDTFEVCVIKDGESHTIAYISRNDLNKDLIYNSGVINYKFLSNGDVVYMNSKGIVEILYRRESQDNTLFITDQCNSYCLMCSQPPKKIDDIEFHFNRNKKLIPLIDSECKILGITGGEPFLAEEKLIEILDDIVFHLPDTRIHILTNGKIFAFNDWVKRVQKFRNELILAIPLYSDNYLDHDYIVQSTEAFRKTILGLHNLAKYDINIELRVVLQGLTVRRLREISKFISFNLPFVESVAFMGLEFTGLAIANEERVWVNPSEYVKDLEYAVLYLHDFGIKVRIFNMPLCVIPDSLFEFTVKSISDWKRGYLDKCDSCKLKIDCGGVFLTSRKLTNEITPIT